MAADRLSKGQVLESDRKGLLLVPKLCLMTGKPVSVQPNGKLCLPSKCVPKQSLGTRGILSRHES
jgi:hypothetical protein